jgi:hypothetical protein
MKRYLAAAFVLCMLSAGLANAQTKPAATDDVAMQADRALAAAYAKGDTAAVTKYLDADFSWIDTDGIMWERPDVLRAGLKPLVTGDDIKRIEFKYGDKVVWIQNNVGKNFAAHFWVKRPEGWRLLHTNEIAVRPAVRGENVRPTYNVPCINPCKEVPYKPLSGGAAGLAGPGRRQSRCAHGRRSDRGQQQLRRRRTASRTASGRGRRTSGTGSGSHR